MGKTKAESMAEAEAENPTVFMPDDAVQVNMADMTVEGAEPSYEPGSVQVAIHKSYAMSEYDVVLASGISVRVTQDRLIPA